jgi:hypothetical protein
LVLWQWFFNYVTRNRAARLITGDHALAATIVPPKGPPFPVDIGGADSPRRASVVDEKAQPASDKVAL